MASARPGSYLLRVRYLAQGIEGATPLQLVSNPVDVEITGGDLAMWKCPADQLAADANHEHADVTPTRLLPRDDGGIWLVFSDYRHRVVDRERQRGGNIWLQALHGDLTASGDALHLRGSGDEVGWISVVAVGSGLLVVATPGPVGDRRVEAFPVMLDGTMPVVGGTRVIQGGPGNPYFTQLVARGDRVALLHEGDEEHGGLQLSMLARSGQPLGPPSHLAEQFTDFVLLPDDPGLLAVWLEQGASEGGVMQRLDADGQPLGEPVHFEFDPSHSLAGARFERDILDLAWSDSGTLGDDPADMMGLYAQRFNFDAEGRSHGARSLSPESRSQAYFGAAAWNGKSRGLGLSRRGEELKLGPDAAPTFTLSVTATGAIKVEARADGFVVLWNDYRDDDSKACRELDDCVSEAYGAVLGPDASVRAGPKRLSERARAKPFVPSSFDWHSHCS